MVIPPAFVNTTFECEELPTFEAVAAPGFEASLSCVSENRRSKTRILVSGGVPPYIVTSNKGEIAAVDVNLFDIKIREEVGTISFPSFSGFLEGDPTIHNCIAIKQRNFAPTPIDPGYDPMLHTLGEKWAYIKLGMNQIDKGIFTECRHHCTFVGFDCFDRYLGLPADITPSTSGTTVGDNQFIIDPFECPFSYENQGSVNYSLPGKGLGPCYDAHDYDLHSLAAYPPVWYYTTLNPDDFDECGKGAIDPANSEETAQAYLDMGGPILDVRHPNVIQGCTPCALVQGTNVTITITDSNLTTIVLTIPIL